jgi:sarcosine oxidase subunit beta
VLESRSQFQRLGGAVILDQHAAGNFLLGSTREFVGYDGRVTVEGLSGIAGAAVRLMPRLANTSVIRCFAGFRPHTPDGLPVLGAIPGGPEGLVMAAGHEGDGITLAPLTAKWISGLIMGCAGHASLAGGTGGAAGFPAHAFSAARFSVNH